MKEFEDAFQFGMNAARAAEFKRREISGVLREFSDSLTLSTNGALGVDLRTEINRKSNALMALLDPTEGRKQWLAVSIKEEPSKYETVAEWRQSAEGYPCTVITAGEEVACYDKVSLQAELARIAASPQMGAVIMRLWGSSEA